jgi:hypothetical protein
VKEQTSHVYELEVQAKKDKDAFVKVKADLMQQCTDLEKIILADGITVKTLSSRIQIKPLRCVCV